ncbi:MAG: hypothetical protein JO056_04840 [Alphaproteobacteria bacterium]|nr:hypothetical protein [Alphaproteobacteria bacterium]
MFHIRSAVFGLLASVAATYPITASALAVEQGEYKLPASFDSEVTTDLQTEEWARVWRPTTDGAYPLVIFLHGNHGTCGRYDSVHKVRVDDDVTYTFSGTCPSGYVVTPNHLGYNYLAKDLASHGYVVVSINANRGVNGAGGVSGDDGRNLIRGRLVLRHMQYLAQWNADGGAPSSLGFDLKGILDFSHVGLMGHSRGGEGMRAAVTQYEDSGSPWPARIGAVTFEAMYEIGPVDGQTSRILNNTGMQWNVLLPGCDGDVSDLEGLKPYDRSMLNTTESAALNKSTFEVFGANHNFYNTEWQLSDAGNCSGETPLFPQYKGSKAQRTTAYETLIPFFLAHVGPKAKPKKAKLFDPSYPLSSKLTKVTAYARGFTPAPHTADNFIVDNFDKSTGTSSEGVANQSSGLTQYLHGSGSSNDDSTQRAAAINWSAKNGFLQVNAANKNNSIDISSYPALEFRVALRCFGSLCNSNPDPTGDVDFSIELANANDDLSSAVALKDVAVVRRPTGAFCCNVIFQTVRVPISDFAGFDPSNFRGVRFIFDRTSASSIYLADVRFTKTPAGSGGLSGKMLPGFLTVSNATQTPPQHPDENVVVATRRITSPSGVSQIEIELQSSRVFPVANALPTLIAGGHSFRTSRFPSGKTDRLIFTLTPAEFAAIPNGTKLTLRIGGARPWSFGVLNK